MWKHKYPWGLVLMRLSVSANKQKTSFQICSKLYQKRRKFHPEFNGLTTPSWRSFFWGVGSQTYRPSPEKGAISLRRWKPYSCWGTFSTLDPKSCTTLVITFRLNFCAASNEPWWLQFVVIQYQGNCNYLHSNKKDKMTFCFPFFFILKIIGLAVESCFGIIYWRV